MLPLLSITNPTVTGTSFMAERFDLLRDFVFVNLKIVFA